MSFSDFKRLGDATKKFHLRTQDRLDFFAPCPSVAPSQHLIETLDGGAPLAAAIGTEKARSEMIVAPILLEVKKHAKGISLFSGTDLNVDAALGLTGTCDFILSRGPEQFMLTAPVVALVEAKRDNILEGLGQCVAEMVAAQLFNEREENDVRAIYGAVTTGTAWTFLCLAGRLVTLDLREYTLSQPERLIGTLLAMATGTAPIGDEAADDG